MRVNNIDSERSSRNDTPACDLGLFGSELEQSSSPHPRYGAESLKRTVGFDEESLSRKSHMLRVGASSKTRRLNDDHRHDVFTDLLGSK